MSSSTEIANLALSHLGVSKEIANLETENSAEANACRRFYEISRDATLRDFPWPFATKFVALGLVAEDPTDEWKFSYRYPSDCLRLRRLLSGNRTDHRQSRASYKITRDSSGLLLYTDLEDAELEYTLKETDTGRFPSDFTMALSLRLAAYIAPRVAEEDPFQLGQRALQLYQFELSRAQASALNEEQPDEDPQSEFIRGREGESRTVFPDRE